MNRRVRKRAPRDPLLAIMVLLAIGCQALALPTVSRTSQPECEIVLWGVVSFDNALYRSDRYLAVSAGFSHSVVLKEDGSIAAWGMNVFSQTNAPPGTDYVAITAGGYHSLALKRDGSIVGWGSNRGSDYNYVGQATPPTGKDFVAITAGEYHSLALKSDGTIVGWGSSFYGQADPPTGNDYAAIAAGARHSLALRSDGTIVGWGHDNQGQATPPSGNDYVAIAAGNSHSLALRSDGTIMGWGWDADGQASPPDGNDYVAVAAGARHSLALRSDGTIVGWGRDNYGEASPPAGNDYVGVAAGGFHNLALRSDGTLVGWGLNGAAQANPPAGSDYVAVTGGSSLAVASHGLALRSDGSIVGWGSNEYGQASPPAGNDYVAVAAGDEHSLALKEDGSIVGWGSNWYLGDAYVGQATPPGGTDYAAIAAGGWHSLALRSDGTIVGWGRDHNGEATPPTGNDYTAIAAGAYHSLALRADGSLVGWGLDDSGQSSPPTGNDYVAISAGYGLSLALRQDGTIASWGGYAGLVPSNDDQYTAVAAGWCHGVALKTDGAIVRLGGNYGDPPLGNDYRAIDAGSDWSPALRIPRPVWNDTGCLLAEGEHRLSGLTLIGKRDPMRAGIAGLPAAVDPLRTHYLTHYASDSLWYTGIAVANPNVSTDAHVSVKAFSNEGAPIGPPVDWTVRSQGKRVQAFDNLFPLETGTGWIRVDSDVDVLAFLVYRNEVNGGLAALPGCQAGNSLVLPHFVSSPNWWTGVAVLNPGATRSQFALRAFQEDGTPIEEKTFSLDPGSKLLGMVEGLLPLTEGRNGWISVETSLDAPVAASVVFGKKDATPCKLAALPAVSTSATMNFTSFVSRPDWWTGIAMVNPSSAAADVTLAAYAEDGTPIDTAYLALPSFHKISGFVQHFFALNGKTTGWIEVTSDRPIVGLEILNAADDLEQAWGMAGVPCQPPGSRLCMPVYSVDWPWWTKIGMANLDPFDEASVHLEAFSDCGGIAARTDIPIPPKGLIWGHVKAVLGVGD